MQDDESQHFIGKVAQKVILEHGDEILVCRAPGDLLWEFPGGRLHHGETPQKSLNREIYEELGIRIDAFAPFHVLLSHHVKSNTHRILIVYRAHVDGTVFVLNQEELEEARWIPREELRALSLYDDCREAAYVFLGL